MSIPRSSRLFVQLFGVLALIASARLDAQPQFVDVTATAGLTGGHSHHDALGWGVAAADYDNDGDIDVFVPNVAPHANLLFRNDGEGLFVEVAGSVGLASTLVSKSALWLDCEGDGDLDLLVAGDCMLDTCAPGDRSLSLYRQNSPTSFTDVTAEDLVQPADLLPFGTRRTGLAAADLTGDGLPDFYAGFWSHGQVAPQLFFNLGDCIFDDVTSTSGVDVIADPDDPPYDDPHQTVIHDFNGDGLMDLFVAVDFWPNHLWINQGDGSFVDEAPACGADMSFNADDDPENPGQPIGFVPFNEMGVALGDPDRDGDFDIYVTNIFLDGKHNSLYRNDTAGGVLDFTDVSAAAGVDDTDWGWGTTFFDADNDGFVDLGATNGWNDPVWNADPSRFFTNLGGPSLLFRDDSAVADFDDTRRGSSLIALDYDRDGDLDALQTALPVSVPVTLPESLRLLKNLEVENGMMRGAQPNRYLVVRPRMTGPNSHALGAVVKARVGAVEHLRLITAGTSYMGQEPAEAFFGLGTADSVDQLTVEWPDGTTSVSNDVAAGQVLDFDSALGPVLSRDAALLALSRNRLDFGEGPGALSEELVLSNATTGSDPLGVTGMTLSDAVNFSLDVDDPSPGCVDPMPTIAAGSSCGITVDFDPAEPAIAFATLTIDSNSAADPTRVVPLTGCSAEADVALSGETVVDPETFVACQALSTGTDFRVETTGQASLRAGQSISLGNGFSLLGSGGLTAELVSIPSPD